MYCGNNRLDPRLTSGQMIIGNRYACLKKGIGIGMRMEPYSGEYDPINRERIYCGKQDILPEGYDRMGNPTTCLQKGIGVGRTLPRRRYQMPTRYRQSDFLKYIFLVILMIGILLLVIYNYDTTVENFNDDNDDSNINGKKNKNHHREKNNNIFYVGIISIVIGSIGFISYLI